MIHNLTGVQEAFIITVTVLYGINLLIQSAIPVRILCLILALWGLFSIFHG